MMKINKIKYLVSLVIISILGCTDIDDNLKLIDITDVIKKDSKLYEVIQTNVENEDFICADFVYPLTIRKYDVNLVSIQTYTLLSDDDFILLLESLNDENSISISYPISTILADGTIFSINNNDELLENLQECYEEIIITQCEGYCVPTLLNYKCFWKIEYDLNTNNDFYLSSFESKGDGTFNFYHNDTTLNCTWIFLYINDELHLNINFEGQNSTASTWNFDWTVENITANQLHIKNGANSFKLTKICTEQIEYTIGNEGPAEGIVIYDKGSYSNGWRYIEAATAYIPVNNLQWGCEGNLIENCDFTEVGKGLNNTKSILKYHFESNFYSNPANCSVANNGSVAAQTSSLFASTTYIDWILPSNDECVLIHDNMNIVTTNLEFLSNYWSSSQQNATNAHYFNITDSEIDTTEKSNSIIKTIPIRYF